MTSEQTPPLGLPLPEREEIVPLVIERGSGWKWVAVGALVIALGLGVAFAVTALGGDEEGTADLVLVPQVTDFGWQDARGILEEAGFVPVHEGVVRTEGTDGTVFEQDPPANSRAASGGFVEIYYTIRPPADEDGTAAVEPPETTTAGVEASPSEVGGTPVASPSPAASVAPPGGEPLDPPWIAIVQSPDNEDDARRLFEERYAADYPDGGYVYSTDFGQMRDGFWVVYVGQFETQADAQAFCSAEFGAPSPGRQPDCYVRTTAG
ncbi:SPOR domain-containing protein [Euzebya pacifica]|jgi:hypothetical protein|uniref:SPOR domain-containing protein n=1 Tax=Euzebya pacifica TaxID=1608957 RepID=UPI0030F653E5